LDRLTRLSAAVQGRTRWPKMRVVILDSEDAVSSYVSAYICQRITEFNPSAQRPFVLGLPTTGTSTISTFQKLVDFYRRNKVSFEHVAVFGMEEFVGLPRDHPASCHSYLWNHLFKHVNIKPENVHMLDGNAHDLFAEHKAYEAKIASYGGIDLFFSGTAAPPRQVHGGCACALLTLRRRLAPQLARVARRGPGRPDCAERARE